LTSSGTPRMGELKNVRAKTSAVTRNMIRNVQNELTALITALSFTTERLMSPDFFAIREPSLYDIT
jgi:hypothetical protein